MTPNKHEILVEFVSNPILREELFLNSTFSGIPISDVLSFRKFLQFNEQELLLNPFIHTKKYLSNDEIEKISRIYFRKYGLHREMYTKKVKLYGLILWKYLLRSKKPFWLIDIAKYEFIMFSQLWNDDYNHNDFIEPQKNISGQYLTSNLCRLGKFCFDIEAYIENPGDAKYLFNHKINKYIAFIGCSESLSVRTKSIDKITYSLIKFCVQSKSMREINKFLKNQLSLADKESINISHCLVSLLGNWNILIKPYSS